MPHPNLAVVTGAFSYTGKYLTRRLLDQGVHVSTLTRSPDAENLFAGQVETAPLDFSDPDGLRRSMLGAGVNLLRKDIGYPIDTKHCGIRGPSIWMQRAGTVTSATAGIRPEVPPTTDARVPRF